MSRRRPNQPPRAWQRMLSGRRLDLLNPSPLDIEIDDIAHGLARVARWNGQTGGTHAFSVAQHCLLVAEIAVCFRHDLDQRWRLAALLHDAPEYVIGDMISPFKAALSLDYRFFETRLQRAIHMRFGLPPALPKTVAHLIKRADRACAFFEATQLAGFDVKQAGQFFGRPRGLCGGDCSNFYALDPLTADEAKAQYLERFHQFRQVSEPA